MLKNYIIAVLRNLWRNKVFSFISWWICLVAGLVAMFIALLTVSFQAGHISWWMFAIAGIVALLITLVTVNLQAIKAAMANPVKSLRTE